MTSNTWEEHFDREFTKTGGRYGNGTYLIRNIPEIKVFIRETLLSHQAEMVRKLEVLKEENNAIAPVGEAEEIDERAYNAALDAAIALIKSNPIV